MSMADGVGRLTGRAQLVLVHVDVGTQGLGPAVHNACCGRAPVLIFAGLSPFTLEGEMKGSRNEFQHWIQDAPDQKQIVAQYCRYAGEVRSGKNIKQMVHRALQFANSNPQGPVYLCAARETMEEEIRPYPSCSMPSVSPAALPSDGVEWIATTLVASKEPLIIVGRTGRSAKATEALIQLANLVSGLHVLDAGGSDMCFPVTHPAAIGTRYGVHHKIESAEVILVVDCDVPWIPTRCKPANSAEIFHIDMDPLKENMSLFYINASAVYQADSAVAIQQMVDFISSSESTKSRINSVHFAHVRERRKAHHQGWRHSIEAKIPANSRHTDPVTTRYLASQLRQACPDNTTWVVEAVTLTEVIAEHISASLPHSWINCGGSGLGWSGGAALGVKLAAKHLFQVDKFVCQIVGDGGYMLSIPSSVHWISRRYELPVLTIVLNNGGWAAPKRSLLMVHPDGVGSKATAEELAISFSPTPDYGGIAKSAAGGNLWTGRASTIGELMKLLPEAVSAVSAGTGAVLEAQLSDRII
ncbi:hypothetical protein N7456_002653 [Penicillium angulare]|uniref:Pyruvate decarboxylase n=1 Tax=Penicillium angulare TaxID=116970 RepID=A0A9W9KP78_9EURO|nr:hypothetical protein N7456_002653 [Penicillium angulare]